MRQNPMLASRVQVGGRPMPSWFSASLVNQSRATMSTPPPLPVEPPPTTDESEYEEIDHLPRPHGTKKSGRQTRRACNLCGNPNPVVSCEMCENHIFCGSCNDMYHRHPKRLHHVRKILESLDNRPPLPPKTFLIPLNPPTEAAPVTAALPPVPPPRRNKRFGFGMGMRSATSSPTISRKPTFDPMGSLKRFVGGMGQRPLPPPPKPGPPLPPKASDFGRPMTPVQRQGNALDFDRRHSSPAPQAFGMQMHQSDFRSRNIPQPVHEIQHPRQQSNSVANLSGQMRPPSRNNGYPPEWEDDDDFFARQRAHSISTPHRYPSCSSQDVSHFATLQRSKRGAKPPERPPPPVPPRNFSSQTQLGFQSSQSVFNLNQMGMTPHQFGVPWNYQGQGYPMDFQQAAMMGYPGTMMRTPSNSSMGGGAQFHPAFGWGPMGFGPPMSQQEMEMELLAARRGSEPPVFNNHRPPSITQSQPVTPQGSFRKKTRPTMNQSRHEMEEDKISERFLQNQQIKQRPSTPSSFARVKPSSSSSSQSQSYEREAMQGRRSSFELESSTVETTEDPEGPWTCEHCTFINPKSTKICTICCKTPVGGYKSMGQSTKSNLRRKESTGSINDDIPVVQSKLSISRGEKQQATFNLTEHVERVKSPHSNKTGGERRIAQTTSSQHTLSRTDEEDANDDGQDFDEELERQAQHHQIRINTRKPKVVPAKPQLTNSNEDVYGSVSLQALTISPKIEIRRPPKTVSTAVGSSPPKTNDKNATEFIVEIKPQTKSSPKSIKSAKDGKLSATNSPQSKSSKSSDSNDNTELPTMREKISKKAENSSTKSENMRVSSTGTTIIRPQNPKQVQSVSTGIQADNGESGNESYRSGASNSNSSSSRSSELSSMASGPIRSDNSQSGKAERKSSKGTSPPPQSISTQTYEELPASSMRQHSMSKTSVASTQSLQSEDFAPQKPIEMSEKALRYARKAQHNHQAKLKRSMSTHLTSATEPWDNIDAHTGRHLYRSSSRHSLISDTRSLPLSGPPSRDASPPSRGSRFYEDFKRFPPPSWDRFPTPEDYFASFEDLVSRKRRDSVRSQEFELTRLLKDAEEYNYTPEDIQVGLRMGGEKNPIKWLQENWSSMVETVQTLATKYGREKGQENNQIGTVSSTEAKDALRTHRGNVWAAVTECVEQRRKKFIELQSRGTFLRDDILTALTANHGNLDAAYVELSKAQLKPFLMRIWGPPAGLDNDAAPPRSSTSVTQSGPSIALKEKNNGESKTLSAEVSNEKILETKVSEKTSSIAVSSEAIVSEENDKKKVEEVKIEKVASNVDIDLKELKAEPRLELLVSNAAKVSKEIEKAIEELKLTKTNTDETSNSTSGTSQKAEKSSPELSTSIQHSVKSDEDESFADAVSDSDANAASPIILERENLIEMEDDFEDEDEDILEIEIDDSEANVSEFIQNYDIVPAKPHSSSISSNSEDSQNQIVADEKLGQDEFSVPVEEKKESKNVEVDDSKENQSNLQDEIQFNESAGSEHPISSTSTDAPKIDEKKGNRLSSTEIEQLLNTLTTTFTEMGQFATEIKAKIATEIQQQLAAAVNGVSASTEGISAVSENSHDANEPLYEPIVLPESINENVNKKIAKYKRLAAKKLQKTNRHKSPDARNSSGKENSSSPSPASSRADASRISRIEVKDANKESLNEIPSPFTDAEIKITGIPSDGSSTEVLSLENTEQQGFQQGFQDYEQIVMGKGETKYLENDDSSESDVSSEVSSEEEVEIEEEEEEEVSEIEEKSDEVVSSDEEEEVQQLFKNDEEVEEVYEEVEISHSSDFDVYSNKDTNKVVINPDTDNQKVSFANPTSDIVLLEKTEEDLSSEILVAESQDLQTPQKDIERKMARLIGDGKSVTKLTEKAELALQLIDMNFGEEDAIFAASECSSLYAALSFLQQECDLCAGKFSARQMVSMLRCTHVCCQNCAKEYFTVQTRDKSIVDATCPFCSEPTNLTEEPESAADYFNNLDILLKSLLEPRYHEMFQRKLRDWALAKTPNFKWCSKCSSGFITEPLQTRLICPDCNAVTCAICLEQWDKTNHDHKESKVKVCDSASKSIVDYLNENCIECPRCHFRFALARGGCMHLTCTNCRHEFCSGCSAPFRMGNKCEAKLPICDRLGLHAHHPRNCLFYLRDKEPETLNKLLEENAIPYLKEDSGSSCIQDAPGATSSNDKRLCQVPIQKDTSEGLKDDVCGKDAPTGYATVCKSHYVEYLGLLIWQNHLDPISILSSDDLEVIIRRAHKKHPGRPYPTSDEEFRNRLLKVIKEEIPL